MPLSVWCSPSVIVHVYIGPSSGHSRLSLSMYRHAVDDDDDDDDDEIEDAIFRGKDAKSSFPLMTVTPMKDDSVKGHFRGDCLNDATV